MNVAFFRMIRAPFQTEMLATSSQEQSKQKTLNQQKFHLIKYTELIDGKVTANRYDLLHSILSNL